LYLKVRPKPHFVTPFYRSCNPATLVGIAEKSSKPATSLHLPQNQPLFINHYLKIFGTLCCIVPNITLSLFQQVGNWQFGKRSNRPGTSRNPATQKQRFMNIENTQSQMRKGILEFCILSVIRRGEAYPSDIVEEMKAANLQILEGTLYPLLTRLKNAEMLTYRWVESNSGPPRKYFSLTEKGEAFYQELEQTWMELSNGVNALAKK
jgi:PadR family transcriptional regulator PadR